MTTSDHIDGAPAPSETVTLGRVANVLPDLFEAQRELEHLHATLRTLHYSLCAFIVLHSFSSADDLALTVESGQALRQLDRIRDDLAAARRRLLLGDRP